MPLRGSEDLQNMLKFACTLCVWEGFLHMHSFRTACRTQARLCLSTGPHLTVIFLTFSLRKAGGGGGLVGVMWPLGSVMRGALCRNGFLSQVYNSVCGAHCGFVARRPNPLCHGERLPASWAGTPDRPLE